MRPIKMELCGWGPYKEKQSIDFEKLSQRGLFLITGDTGAGKTTIFDAITYSLFGEMSGPVREKNSVRSDFADENTPTYVELTMSHRGKLYHICRRPEYMRLKKRKVGTDAFVKEKEYALLTISDNEKVEGSVAVTRKIQEILGMDIRQFRQISMIAQGEFAKLLTASPKEKMQIFRDIFGTAFYERFAGILRSRSLELYRELQMYEHKIEEDIDSFDCEDMAWKEIALSENRLPESVCAYLLEKEAAEKKEKKRLSGQLEQTEVQLEQISTKCNVIGTMLRQQAEAVKLEQEKVQTQEIYQRKDVVEKWLLFMGRCLEQKQELEAAARVVAEAEKRLSRYQNAYQIAEQQAADARKELDTALSQYRQRAIGIVAALVKEGEPCPVCGAIEHPHIARREQGVQDENRLKALQKECERAEKQLTDTYGAALAGKKELEHRLEQQKKCEEALKEIRTQYQKVKESCGQDMMEKLIGDKEVEPYELSANQIEQGKLNFQKAVSGYQRAEALLSEKRKAVEEGLKQLSLSAVEEATDKERELLEKRSALAIEKRQLEVELRKNYALLENAGRVRKALTEKLSKMQIIKQKYGIVKDLDNLTSGNNAKKLVFEQYVLAGYFEEILRAANRRLERMTSGRFALYRVDEIGDGRSKDNLEIRVLDHYTGRYRSVKTLSGGETFKASLALALGLSDVIQMQSGGISVDCLFVDEGFGALDGESLEQACQTLRTLVSGNCMIGIISHVPQLREEIENKLIVKRTGQGSFVEFS